MSTGCVYQLSNSCPESAPYCTSNTSGDECVEECTKFFFGETKSCVANCPNNHPYLLGKECLAECPEGYYANDSNNCLLKAEESNGVFDINWSDLWTTIVSWCSSTGVKLVIAIVLLIILFYIINFLSKRLYRILLKSTGNQTPSSICATAFKYILKLLVVVSLVTYVGIATATISALVAAVGVAIGLALQGSLGNLAGGIIIYVAKPFSIGDYIVSNGAEGTVEFIDFYYTSLVTVDNCVVYIPNGSLANGVIVNKSKKDTRRVDIVMSVDYSTNIELAKKVLLNTAKKHELVLKDPEFAPVVYTSTYAGSSIDLSVRCWCEKANYWTVFFDLMDDYKKALDKKGIEIPFSQMDLHIKDAVDLGVKKRAGKSHDKEVAKKED